MMGKHKVALLGRARSGKTAIALRMVSGIFGDAYEPTDTAGFLGVSKDAREQGVLLQLWDTVGFGSLDSSAGDSEVYLVIYDVTDVASFHAAADIAKEARDGSPETPIVLVGSKSDAPDRQVLEDDGKAMAANLDAYFAEVSAKTGAGIEDLEDLVLEVLWDRSFTPETSRQPDLVLTLSADNEDSASTLVNCISMAGTTMASLLVTDEDTVGKMRLQLLDTMAIPRRRLKMVLPCGDLLKRRNDTDKWRGNHGEQVCVL
jgi:small GTP-binding protein